MNNIFCDTPIEFLRNNGFVKSETEAKDELNKRFTSIILKQYIRNILIFNHDANFFDQRYLKSHFRKEFLDIIGVAIAATTRARAANSRIPSGSLKINAPLNTPTTGAIITPIVETPTGKILTTSKYA